MPALAAVLIFSAIQLIDFHSYKELQRVYPAEFRLSILTTLGVLSLGVLPGVAVAILMALILIMLRIYKPDDTLLGVVPGLLGYNDLALSPDSKTVPGVLIWRFEGPIVFFNSEYFQTRVAELIGQTETAPRWLVLSMESVSQIDATGLKALEELHSDLEKRGITLLIARPKIYMRKLREETGLNKQFTTDNAFPTITAAVNAIALREGSQTDGGENLSFQSFYELQGKRAKVPDQITEPIVSNVADRRDTT